jgi:hypothetical protein
MQVGEMRLQAKKASAPAAIAAAAIVLCSGICLADTKSWNKTTKINHEVIISTHAQWEKNCGPRGLPAVNIEKQPNNGKVFTRSGRLTITYSFNEGSNPRCKGRQVTGIFVVYTPDSGFIGTDELAYTVTYHGTSQRIENNTVHVKVVSGSDAPSVQK